MWKYKLWYYWTLLRYWRKRKEIKKNDPFIYK